MAPMFWSICISRHIAVRPKEMLAAVKRVLVRSESLRRAVVDLGCDENKIDIVRTGIPARANFPFASAPFRRTANGDWCRPAA